MQQTAEQRHRAAVQRMVKAAEELEAVKARVAKTDPEYLRAVSRYLAARTEAYGGK
jgi:hypothetical protein